MKTPMQEHLEYLKKMRINAIRYDNDPTEYDLTIIHAKKMLEKEKAQLKLAFEDERDLLSCYEDGSAFEKYYNETFNENTNESYF